MAMDGNPRGRGVGGECLQGGILVHILFLWVWDGTTELWGILVGARTRIWNNYGDLLRWLQLGYVIWQSVSSESLENQTQYLYF